MKGFYHLKNYHQYEKSRKYLTRELLGKILPYGKWTTHDQKEYLFNRDYEPILGWDLVFNSPIAVTPSLWILAIDEEKTEYYYGGNKGLHPGDSMKTLRKCWDILADWSERERKITGRA